MDIITELKKIFSIEQVTVSERVTILELSFESSANNILVAEKYDMLFKMIPPRDNMIITLICDNGDSLLLHSNEPFPTETFNSAISDTDDTSTITVKIEIKKYIQDNVFSIYFFDIFSADLLNLSLENIMSSFALLLKNQDYLTFEILSGDYFFTTETMAFVPEQRRYLNNTFVRTKRLTECEDISNFYNKSSLELLPDDFSIKVNFENNPLTQTFEKICALLSLAYISNNAILENGKLTAQITGQRRIEYSHLISDTNVNVEFYKIYSWIYTGGSAVDKAIIARNIISLHCRYSPLSEIDEKTFSSIQSNYNIYLKENVVQYIELKNKLAEFICDVISKIGDYTTELLHNLKNNFVAIFGFLFTVMLANIVSEQPLESIFTRDITVILDIVLLGSFIYLIICNIETRYKLKKVVDSYNLLKKNYSSILSDADLEEAFDNDKLLERTQKTVNFGIWGFTIVWFVFLVITLIILENLSCSPVITPWLSDLISTITAENQTL